MVGVVCVMAVAVAAARGGAWRGRWGREEEGGVKHSRLRWEGREDTSRKGAGDRRLTDEDGEDEEVDTKADAEANIWVEIRRQDGAGMTRRW